jgi:membrane-bound lytic murein transglycosylase D
LIEESVLLKPRIFLLPVMMLFLLCGCVQAFFKNPVSRDKDNVSASTSAPDFEKSTEKVNNKDQESSHIDPMVAENSMESSAPDPSKNEDIIPDNSSLIKNIQPVLDEALDFCQVSQDFWQKGELENALEALDQAYSLILKIDTNDNPEIIQQKEDLRFMISKRILEIYASRNIVVNGNHNAIPMVMNKHIQDAIDQYTKYNEKDFFIESYKRSGKYRPLIVSDLRAAGLPVELSWLPLIESGFKVNAFSRARALGLWQFIPSTGYKFGLKRNKYIDERIDPVKATKAAIEYLKELHKIFGDWTTALAAYNCGEGKVLRVIRSQKINYLDNFFF